MDSLTELAKIFKDRDNPTIPSITIGRVIAPPPEAEIKLNEFVVLKKDNLIFSSHMLQEYKRELELEGEIKFTDSNAGSTSDGSSVTNLNVDTNYESKKVKFTMKDTIKAGDEVIIMPTMDEQLYVVIDKAVRL
jgi:LEA14-like dessication related protein